MSAKIPTTQPGLAEDNFRDSPLEHIRSLFVGFLQGLFYSAPVQAYHWSPNDDESEIYISDENPVKDSAIGLRPAFAITRGPMAFYSLGLDDMFSIDQRTGQKRKEVLVPGTMTINALSRVALESERLAWIAAENLWLHRELFMKAGVFEVGRQPNIGSPSPAGSLVAGDSADEFFVTSVTCPVQLKRASQTTPLNQAILHNISLSLQARLRGVRSQDQGPIDSPTGQLPYQYGGTMPPEFSPASDARGNTPNPGNGPPVLPMVPHPLNPAQMVTVRASRPNSPAVRRPALPGGRPIPLPEPSVEESSGASTDAHVTSTITVKV